MLAFTWELPFMARWSFSLPLIESLVVCAWKVGERSVTYSDYLSSVRRA
jgi:hypothetical protein